MINDLCSSVAGDDDDTASQTLSDDITDTTDISDTDANMTDLPGMNEPPTIKISAPDGAGVVMRHQCEGHVTGSRSASLSDQSSQISDSEDDDDEGEFCNRFHCTVKHVFKMQF